MKGRAPLRLRRLIAWTASAVLVAAVLLVAGVGWVYTEARHTSLDGATFTRPLAIPPLDQGRLDADGRRVFELTLETGSTELVPGIASRTWGVNGSYLGPTLRASRGEDVAVRVVNRLPEATSLHWHGMHLPAVMDGGPHQLIRTGDTWRPEWSVDQPAATLWYHAHPHERTAAHVYQGLAGLFIIDDDPADLLPSTYGVDDIPLVVQDKIIDDDGSLSRREGPANLVGVLGGEILVNGTHSPRLRATSSLVRLRVLNASNARVYNFGFDDDRGFSVVGTDSGLVQTPVETRRVQLSPGERAELVVALEPGDRAILRSYPPDLGMGRFLERLNGGDDTFDILLISAETELDESPPLPSALTTIVPPDPDRAAGTRRFTLSGFSRINGQEMAMDRIDAVVSPGATEIWEIHNDSNTFHNFHVHDVRFWVLDRDGREPPAVEQGWKDTVFVAPGDSSRIIARFAEYADDAHPYMFHCHILDHEDAGMMGQFIVSEAHDSA